MSEVIWNNILATGYLLIWIMTLVWYQYKSRTFDGGTAVMSTYILYAIFSLLTLNDIMFSDFYLPLKIFPYIYYALSFNNLLFFLVLLTAMEFLMVFFFGRFKN